MLIIKRIIAIGGGENGRPGTNYETREIDQEIVKLTNKKNPNFLFISHANKYANSYYEVILKIYRDIFKCKCKHFNVELLKEKKVVKELLEWADIIYVGGGNTLKLMNYWKKYQIIDLLKKACNRGVVLCGVSAGGICWCEYGNSDSRRFTSDSSKLIKVSGLGLIKVLFCPHYNVEVNRQEDLKRMMKKTYKIPAIALDNGTALEIIDDKFRILKSIESAKARKCYWKNGKYIIKDLKTENFKNIFELINK